MFRLLVRMSYHLHLLVFYFLRLSVSSCPFRYLLPNRNLVSPIRSNTGIQFISESLKLSLDLAATSLSNITSGGAGGNRTLVLNTFLFTSYNYTTIIYHFAILVKGEFAKNDNNCVRYIYFCLTKICGCPPSTAMATTKVSIVLLVNSSNISA